MPFRPDLGPWPRLGYTQSLLQRVAERRGEAARVLVPGGRVSVFDKFLSDGATASAGRRAASAVTRILATELNRQLGPLVDAAGLQVARREPVGLNGAFIVARLEKPDRRRMHGPGHRREDDPSM